jgi:PEP-CTERM motif
MSYRNVRRIAFAILTAAFGLSLGFGRASAAVVTYTDSTAFDAATTNQSQFNFNAALTCSGTCYVSEATAPATFSYNGVTFATPSGNITVFSADYYAKAGFGTPYSSAFLAADGSLTLTLSSAVRAFGIDFATEGSSNVSFQLSNASTPVGSTSVPTTSYGPPQFEGFVSSTPFDTITISSLSPDSYLVFDVTTAAVPEPATWAMLILGFAGIGFMYRRKQNAAAFTVA